MVREVFNERTTYRCWDGNMRSTKGVEALDTSSSRKPSLLVITGRVWCYKEPVESQSCKRETPGQGLIGGVAFVN